MYSILVGMGFDDDTVVLTNPYDKRCRPWNMAADIETATDAETLANILVPEKKDSKSDDFWRSATILLIKAVIRYFNRNCPGQWRFRDVLLTLRDRAMIMTFIEDAPQLKHYTQSFGSDRTADNIMSTVITKVERFEPIAALWHKAETEYHNKPFSLTEWIDDSKIMLLGRSATAKVQMEEINRVLLTRLTQLLQEKPEIREPESFILLDEFGSLGNLETVLDLASEGRSKGVSLVLGFQDESRIESNFGENIASSILSQFNHVAVLRVRDRKSAEWLSTLAGKVRGLRTTQSVSQSWEGGASSSLSQTQFEHDVVSVGELTNIPIFEPDRGVGLTGFYMGRANYWHTYPPNIVKQLAPKADSSLNKDPMPRTYQDLDPWDDDDLERLNITHLFQAGGQGGTSDLDDFDY